MWQSNRNIGLYYAYKSTKAVEFYRPIMYLYFLSLGLDYTGIAILEGIYNVTTLVSEIPTGYVGDRVGRRNSLLIGTTIITLTLVGIGFAGNFAQLAVLYACWSFGYTFRSGSSDAWLYDTLTDDLSEDRFAHVRGRGQAVALLVGVVGSVLGGYLGNIDLAYPFLVAAGVTGIGVPVLLAMDEPTSYEESESDELGVREAVGVIRETLSNPRLRAFVVYYFVLFSAVSYLVFMYVQPVLETVLPQVGVPKGSVEPILGWFYAAISLLSAGLSYYTGAIRERIGIRTWFLVIPFVVGLGLVTLRFVPVLAIPAFLFARGIAETTRSLASQYVNDRIETLGRATVLSALAMVSSLTVIPFQLGSGLLSDAASPLTALAVAGGVLVVGSLAVLGWESPVKSATGQRAEAE
ncbi:major facilitator superfamily MFS_1 [Haladaptatus paucihalophilus DX253]|uniref:Major facilitator superfamily MFS_1 n=1 Tax=Haladaptatus paucihalophilus DX253 TaxID=797209 RepID=E7QXT6_HALPU|nr:MULTISPECIES: MFS transporter [Haladaptatus]EFW90637.1 major facilitator superfamily MFS_1 [Haladaptatus paucihalophilus DX253]GKZ14835.1 MFS transporter [Haladaptatus sp. T7]SHL56622.1 Predicted arabinose efflux permease, MFS family [Haladaptatus paucihalophilus DX253]